MSEDGFDENYDPFAEGRRDDDDPPDGSAQTRFGAGQKRNTRGRPKGAKDHKAIVRRIASKRMFVLIDGERKRLTYFEILIGIVRNASIKAEHAALNAADLVRNLSAGEQSDVLPGVLIVPATCETEEEWEARNRPGWVAAHRQAFKDLTGGYYDELLDEDIPAILGGGYEPAVIGIEVPKPEATNQSPSSQPPLTLRFS